MMDETQQINQYLPEEKTLSDYLSAFGRRKYQFLLLTFLLLVVTLLITFLLPAIYKSSAIILIEQQEIPQDLVRSTVTSYADQRIQVISQRVMTTTNMKAIIDKYNLYEEEQKTDPMQLVMDEMRKDIRLDMISADVVDPRTGRTAQATIAFTLAYESKSPGLAQKVANELVSLFLNENLKNRTEMAEEANSFLQEEADRLGEKVNQLEQDLATFKESHSGSLPEMHKLNIEFMDRQERELAEVKRQRQALEERRIYLQSELLQLSPNLGTFSETGERILGPRDRLKVLESRYISLLSRYSADHPDVVSMKKEIQALENEVGINKSQKEVALRLKEAQTELTAKQEKYSAEHPDIRELSRLVSSLEQQLRSSAGTSAETISDERPDNPAYIRLETELEATRSETLSLRSKEEVIREKLGKYEERLTESPVVEQEYRALLREYENSLLKFKEIKAKQMEAQLAQNLESEKKGERFTLIEPPLLPEEPDKPNRLALFFLGLIGSLGIGLGSVAVSESLDRSVYGRKGVERVLGELPLTVIPYIETMAERRRRYFRYGMLALSLLVLFLAALTAFHYFIKPLDVTWFLLARKLGLG